MDVRVGNVSKRRFSMKTEKIQQNKRILARTMARELSEEQLKQAAGSHLGTCTNCVDCDSAEPV